METETMKKKGHGPNVTFWREWKKMTQEQVSELTGYSQGALSKFEKKEILEPEVLDKLAKALEIPVEAITEMGNEGHINIISGSWHDYSSSQQYNYNPTFNPIDRVAELYERMLKEKQSVIDLLQEIVKGKG